MSSVVNPDFPATTEICTITVDLIDSTFSFLHALPLRTSVSSGVESRGCKLPEIDMNLLKTKLVLVIALVLLTTVVLPAQTTIATGSIQGTVTDSSGAIVADANVIIANTATGQSITRTTSGGGVYSSGALTPGRYEVRVEAKGFNTAHLSVTVQVSNTATGNVKLTVGSESQVVEVKGSVVGVNTEQATIQGVLTAQQIESLPVNGRNFLDLAQLEPGVQIQDGTNFDPTKIGYSSISFGGRFGRTARIEVDGVDISDETVGTTTQDIPASAIEEFSLSQSNLDLSNELSSSGAVNVVTRSGTNLWHGEGFYLFRDSRAAASLPVAPGTKSPFQRSQYGGNFGGPIVKDKLFFFLDAEKIKQSLQAPIVLVAPFAGYSGNFSSPFKDGSTDARLDYNFGNGAKAFYRNSYFQNQVFGTASTASYQVYKNKDYSRQNVVGVDFSALGLTQSVRFSYLKFQNNISDAVRGSKLPFANFPLSINIGLLQTGPNYLAPQATVQTNLQGKYDGSKVWGKHILRFGGSFTRIQGGGFAAFYSITPNVSSDPNSLGCSVVAPDCPAGPDGTPASNPLNYLASNVILSNGQGYSSEIPALGYPAGGLGPDNRIGLYIGDSWKIRKGLTLSGGVRWVRDTGRLDSDLAAISSLNAAFPGAGNKVSQPNLNFAPQFGVAWDPTGAGKTVFRGGIGLFYENVIFNNILYDRPSRLAKGAFLSTPNLCLSGVAQTIPLPGGKNLQYLAADCTETIGQAAADIALAQTNFQAATPFDLKASNPNFVGNLLSQGLNIPFGMFAPRYRSPRSIQMNIGLQREIRPGTVLSVDLLRNVTTHFLLGVDINHVGDSRYFNLPGALEAIQNTVYPNGTNPYNCQTGPVTQQNAHTAVQCVIDGKPNATISDFANSGLTSADEFGGPGGGCPLDKQGNPLGCAFGGINPKLPSASLLAPIGRSVYNALQMKLTQNVKNPFRYTTGANFQLAYSWSRFVNPGSANSSSVPSVPSANGDQDFVLNAADNRKPSRYMGPSALDRTHQISFGGTFDVVHNFQVGVIGHLYSPLSSPAIVSDQGNFSGTAGGIYRTDFTGDGTTNDLLPGTRNGAFGRDFGVGGLAKAIQAFNAPATGAIGAGNPTPAGAQLIAQGILSQSELVQLQGVPQLLTAPVTGQAEFTWLKSMDLRLSWSHMFFERLKLEPSVGFYNVFNFANFNLPPGTLNGYINSGVGSITDTTKANNLRVGQGTGVFGLGSPRVLEFGMKMTF